MFQRRRTSLDRRWLIRLDRRGMISSGQGFERMA
jgi:hypothetical protein